MSHVKDSQDAERAVAIALTRWQSERDRESLTDTEKKIDGYFGDSTSFCLIDFTIEGVVRHATKEHKAPLPITDFFKATVTLTITPRPTERCDRKTYLENATDIRVISRTCDVKHFIDGTWFTFYA